MAECNTQENIEPLNSITGNFNRSKQLYYQLKEAFKDAERIDFIVSFLMESGIKMILPDLRQAVNRGVKIRILTGKYLGITQPTALYLLKSEFGDKIDLRFYYTQNEQSFHPKAYFFHKQYGSDVFVGSSNISRSALTNGVEWNYRLNSNQNQVDFDEFYEAFENLFNNHSVVIDDEHLNEYAKSWHKPAVAKDLERDKDSTTKTISYEYSVAEASPSYSVVAERSVEYKTGKTNYIICEPRGVQIEALYALAQSRKEGADRGLIQAATGIGKTYLAAFDSKNYEHVLFVAHREEILNQAATSFANVRCSNDYGFFNGKVHDTNKAVIFASVASLGKDEYLNNEFFTPDYFDYIVVDEFHHAVNKQYEKIIEYFKPKFLLGLTATPERTDGRSIYEICDYNVPYEINLYQAINRGILVPFHYYGIYDETDYSGLKFVKGDYLESELNVTYLNNRVRDNLIYKHYLKYHSRKALGFCCSRVHAEYMAGVFTKKGIPAVAVYSNADGEYSEDRAQAIKMLEEGRIKTIFCVDMFNEGVDIPEVDMVMFLRPTQSGIVFLQQLGRGLRTSKGKEYLNVLDFIGNYRFAGKNISLLSEQKSTSSLSQLYAETHYPDGCLVDFDMELIDLFERMEKRTLSIHQTIQNEFNRIKELLDKVPTRMELFTYMDEEIYNLCLSNAKENPFRDYLGYLEKESLLTEEETSIHNSNAGDFLIELERTSMTRSYKMPVLYSFIGKDSIRQAVTEEELLQKWKEFFAKNRNWKDLPKVESYQDYLKITDKAHLDNIKKNPVNFLKQSAPDFFVSTKSALISLTDGLVPFLTNPIFVRQVKDIVDYRTVHYYSKKYRDSIKIPEEYKIPDPDYLMVADTK